MNKLYSILIFLFLFSIHNIKGNTNYPDSLFKALKQVKEDSLKINIYHEIGFHYEFTDPDSAKYFFSKALKIAQLKTKTLYNQIINNKTLKDKISKIDLQYLLLASLSNRYIGFTYNDMGDFKTAIQYYENANLIAESILPYSEGKIKSSIESLQADNKLSVGLGLYYISKYDEALLQFDAARKIYEYSDDSLSIAKCYTCYGMVCRDVGDRDCAIENFHKSLKIYLKFNSKFDIASAYGNLAHIYMQQKDLELALEYYDQALEIFIELEIPGAIGKCHNGKGIVYEKQGKYNEAEENYIKYLEISKKASDKYGMSAAYTNLAVVFKLREEYTKSLDYYNKSYEIDLETGDRYGQALVLNNMSIVYKFIGQYQKSIECAQKALKINEDIGRLHGISLSFENLSALYDSLGDYKKAYYYHWHFKEIHDSIYSETSDKRIRELEEKYQAEQRQLEIEKLENEKALQSEKMARTEAENQRQKNLIITFVVIGLLILVFSLFLLKLYIQKKRANHIISEKNQKLEQANEEIEAQRDEIAAQRDLAAEQRDLIAEQKQDITASIEYALNIQSAVIPDDETISGLLQQYFIIYKPRDIVSGDFYWIQKVENKVIVIAADCTGHGVPGAFMSMMGVAFLNDIILKEKTVSPAEILNKLRNNIIKALKQQGKEGDILSGSGVTDGMDVAAISIDFEKHEMEFAGANNPLYMIKNDTLIETKGNKMPVAIYSRMDDFTNHSYKLEKEETIYIFSDGYADQFGGPKGKKFKYANFKKLLLENNNKPMFEQKQILNETFETWRGNYDQIDDVLVLGIKI